MPKPILTMLFLAATLMAGTVGAALAKLSEPDVMYYGTALTAGEGGVVAITLTGAAAPLASFTVGPDRRYTLRVPMDALEPRLPGTARSGDTATISVDGEATALVSASGEVTADGSVVIPPRGTVVQLDLGTRTKEQWDVDHPGDNGSGDMNRNGISDLTEYLSGKDPAGCVWDDTDTDIVHVATTVYHQAVLQNCLADAGKDLRHNVIRVARGTFAGNFSYVTAWGEAFDLSLVGGYDPAGSASRTADPTLTVLTGDTDNDGAGNGITLAVDTDTSKTPGTVHIEGLTIMNGTASAGQNGGGIQARFYRGSLELSVNIFRDNSADGGGGLSVETSDTGSLLLANNLFTANSAATAAAARIVAAASGPVTLLNNTFAGNTATTAGGYGRTLVVRSSAAAVDLTNNIVAGVAGGSGSEIYVDSSGNSLSLIITHNAYDSASGLYVNAAGFVDDGSSIGGQPLFAAPGEGNFRLGAASPCIDTGTGHSRLPLTDIDGLARISGTGVDRGAHEFQRNVTNQATAVTGSGATLNGMVYAGNLDTTVTFDYGTTNSYGSSASAVPGTVTGSAATPVSAVITGLTPNTLYHVRVRGVNGGGTSFGNDVTFVTLATSRLLSITVYGSGTGTVASDSGHPGIACPGTCQAYFGSGEVVTLTPYPSATSLFGGWFGGSCSGTGPCSVTMTGDIGVSATFNPAGMPVRVGTITYATVPLAYAPETTVSGATIKIQERSLLGDILFDLAKSVILRGGYDSGFEIQTGYTTLQGTVTIRSGSVVVDRVIIK